MPLALELLLLQCAAKQQVCQECSRGDMIQSLSAVPVSHSACDFGSSSSQQCAWIVLRLAVPLPV